MVWPKGRLAAFEAPEQGEFWTVRLTPPGRTVRINAVTQRAGKVLAEICDFDGHPVAGRSIADAKPIIGDQYDKLLEWSCGGDIGLETGRQIILHFVRDHAKIYG
jgi:hypothetical protein